LLLAAAETDPVPLIVVMLLGFVVGTVGHVYKSRSAIATGIALIFLATIVLPGIIYFRQD
jgi:F0F1-type ATP synthase assembly protein I